MEDFSGKTVIVTGGGRGVGRGVGIAFAAAGANVMLGYWNKPEQTAEALKGGWMHSGDGGYMDEQGFVYIVDRVKDMIISGGENVYSAEVENAVYQHPAVAECAVIGIPHETWGEQVHAIVRLHDGKDASEQDVIEFSHTLIAGFKCPRSVASPIGRIRRSRSASDLLLRHSARVQSLISTRRRGRLLLL